MRRILFLALFLLAVAVPALAQDAVKVDPKHYTVESENARVRVLRIKYGPHEKSVMHRHPPGVAVYLTDGKMKFTYPDGRSEEREAKAGQTVWTPATTHLPENVTDHDIEIILVELRGRRPAHKKPAGPGTTTTTTPPGNK
jgi:quercetin dioxygenase-like cupin family protein